ncbi:MAG TPA: tyrosine-type recombinase/integrase [Thermoplasmata archaeon]|nr:tyrosine-type recombinase/integrase [Thermoplasmata archaeon]
MGRLPYRWWRDRSKECVEKKRERGEAGKKWLDREARILERFPGDIWRRVGITSPPSSGSHVTRGQVIALRDADPSIFRGTTRSQYLQALREYLRFEGNPIANERVLWSVDTSDVRRRWLTRAQLGLLWSVCRDGKDRLIVAMLGFNGLRRIELLRLRVRDLTLVADVPRAHVLGKGRGSGKWREIPLSSLAYGALVETSTGRSADARVYPGERTDVDHRLSELGERAGIPVRVSSHDLRRSFGRVAYYSGVPLVDLQHIYGHASPTMTAHYIGIDLAEMAAGLALFDKAMRPSLATPESRGG